MLTLDKAKLLFKGFVILCVTAVVITALVKETPLGQVWDAIKLMGATLVGS